MSLQVGSLDSSISIFRDVLQIQILKDQPRPTEPDTLGGPRDLV